MAEPETRSGQRLVELQRRRQWLADDEFVDAVVAVEREARVGYARVDAERLGRAMRKAFAGRPDDLHRFVDVARVVLVALERDED